MWDKLLASYCVLGLTWAMIFVFGYVVKVRNLTNFWVIIATAFVFVISWWLWPVSVWFNLSYVREEIRDGKST